MKKFLIFYHIAQTVRTHQYDVSPFQTVLVKVYLYIRFRADRSRNNIFIRMMFCFFRFYPAKPYHLFYQGMIFRKLLNALIDQIQTAVSYIREIHHLI